MDRAVIECFPGSRTGASSSNRLIQTHGVHDTGIDHRAVRAQAADVGHGNHVTGRGQGETQFACAQISERQWAPGKRPGPWLCFVHDNRDWTPPKPVA